MARFCFSGFQSGRRGSDGSRAGVSSSPLFRHRALTSSASSSLSLLSLPPHSPSYRLGCRFSERCGCNSSSSRRRNSSSSNVRGHSVCCYAHGCRTRGSNFSFRVVVGTQASVTPRLLFPGLGLPLSVPLCRPCAGLSVLPFSKGRHCIAVWGSLSLSLFVLFSSLNLSLSLLFPYWYYEDRRDWATSSVKQSASLVNVKRKRNSVARVCSW